MLVVQVHRCSSGTERRGVSAGLLAGGSAERGVRLRGRRSIATGVGVPFCHRWSPGPARAKPADGGRCVFLDRYGAKRGFDTRLGGQGGAMRHGGVAQAARHVSNARATTFTATPRRGSGGSRGGSQRGIEFGANLERIWDEGDRGRSKEVGGGRRRSTEIDRDRPIFADLRSASLAGWTLDPNLVVPSTRQTTCILTNATPARSTPLTRQTTCILTRHVSKCTYRRTRDHALALRRAPWATHVRSLGHAGSRNRALGIPYLLIKSISRLHEHARVTRVA